MMECDDNPQEPSPERMEIDEEKIEVREIKKMSRLEAAAIFLKEDMSKKTYSSVSKKCRKFNAPIFPCYPLMSKILKKSFPKDQQEKLKCSDNEVDCPMQTMLNVTAARLCESRATKWKHLDKLSLTVSIGFDSSGGHANAQQKYKDKSAKINKNAEESLLVTNMTTLQLKCSVENCKGMCNFYNFILLILFKQLHSYEIFEYIQHCTYTLSIN